VKKIAIAAMLVLFSAPLAGRAGNAGPMPLGNVDVGVAAINDLTLVRDGCGRGYRFSHRRGGCVPDYVGPRYVAPHYVGPRVHRGPRVNGDAAAAAVASTVLLGIVGASQGRHVRQGRRVDEGRRFR